LLVRQQHCDVGFVRRSAPSKHPALVQFSQPVPETLLTIDLLVHSSRNEDDMEVFRQFARNLQMNQVD
jgi:hypothetical protein